MTAVDWPFPVLASPGDPGSPVLSLNTLFNDTSNTAGHNRCFLMHIDILEAK
ncbi:hypothetical protein OYC64_006626 [Pagothenia borchgrevinki]|uniref:Uncharacterized protein n=1 Tax=Pagothenia borchgrevinki TaxID=8213 RepID=A0ABD2GJX6_PAGBO